MRELTGSHQNMLESPPRETHPARVSARARRTPPLRFIVARGERVHAVTVTPWIVASVAAAGLMLAAWLISATAYIVFRDDFDEARSFYLVEKHRAYEERIALLRRQIDEINTRQYLDQDAVERRLEALGRRQAHLETRQVSIAGLVDDARRHNLALDLEKTAAATIEESHSSQRQGLARGAFSLSYLPGNPLLTGRPRPQETASTDRLPASPATREMRDIDDSLERMAAVQAATLEALADTVGDTLQRLAAVPKAIGAPMPDAAMEDGIGGPLVELRGSDRALEAEDEILTLSSKIDRISVLKDYVSRLPVRLPIAGNARMTSRFGRRMDPFLRRPAMHTGVDFRARTGTPVHAVAAGRATTAAYSGGYGNLVEIDHGNGYSTRYAHLSEILVKRGESIEPGQLIGKVGSTGRSTGPHLHYETRISGRPHNPAPFIEAASLLPDGF